MPSEAPLGSPSLALEAERRRASTILYYPSLFAARGAERRARRQVRAPRPSLGDLGAGGAHLARISPRELISGSSGVLGDQRPVASLFLEVVRVSFLLEDDRSIDRVRAAEHHDHLA